MFKSKQLARLGSLVLLGSLFLSFSCVGFSGEGGDSKNLTPCEALIHVLPAQQSGSYGVPGMVVPFSGGKIELPPGLRLTDYTDEYLEMLVDPNEDLQGEVTVGIINKAADIASYLADNDQLRCKDLDRSFYVTAKLLGTVQDKIFYSIRLFDHKSYVEIISDDLKLAAEIYQSYEEH